MGWGERLEEGRKLYEQLKTARERWDALPEEQREFILKIRKFNEDLKGYITDLGAIRWWKYMRSQGHDVERPPKPRPRPTLKD